jgi:hypothetical protein
MIHLSNNTVSYGQKYCQISLAYSCKDKRGPYSKVKKKQYVTIGYLNSKNKNIFGIIIVLSISLHSQTNTS